MSRPGSPRRRALAGVATTLAALGLLALGAAAGDAQPSRQRGAVTIDALFSSGNKPAYDILISNFERAYPNITVNAAYAAGQTDLQRLITTELAAGNAPDVFATWPGCGTSISVCRLAKAGDLALLVRKPWAKRSLPDVISASKYGAGLFTSSPTVNFGGLWTNDTMFRKLGLGVPQTFPQLLDLCRTAKATGTIPLLLPASGSLVVQMLAGAIALTTVYAKDKQWKQKLESGKVTFQGTPGWHQALQEFVDMKNAGCFEPGPAGVTTSSANNQFAQGRALMYVNITSHKGSIDATPGQPPIVYSQHPFPATSKAGQQVVLLNFSLGMSVNAHSSAQHQAAAQKFVDFLARPKQAELYARINGGLTHDQFMKRQIPAYLSSFKPFLKKHQYGVNPVETWWNATVGDNLTMQGTGLITGQTTIDDVLEAMDQGWKLGPL